MTTRDTIQGYFDSLKQKGAWDAFLANEMLFTSFTTPIKRVTGKGAYLEATKRFYSMIKTLGIRGIVVEGERGCVLTRYELQPPGGPFSTAMWPKYSKCEMARSSRSTSTLTVPLSPSSGTQEVSMVRDDKLLSRVRPALAHVPNVEEKRMFGGTAFMVRGKMCISAGRERIMCRIDPAFHDAALKRRGCQTVVMKGRQYRGYVYVDAESLRKKDALGYWIDLALKYNSAITRSI
jgi:TfoX/Sxy family transcriptional regulator of competence genes